MATPSTDTSRTLRSSKRRRINSSRSPRVSCTGSSSSSSTTRTTNSAATARSSSSHSSSRCHPSTLRRFLAWCTTNDIHISPLISLHYQSFTPHSWSISVHASPSTSIPVDTVIATIPKSAILSRRTSALAPYFFAAEDGESDLTEDPTEFGLELALCLLYERCLGRKSRFKPFLDILPRLPVPLPTIPTSASSDSWEWLTGTEASRIHTRADYAYDRSTCSEESSHSSSWPYTHDFGMSLARITAYFHTTGIAVLGRTPLFDETQKQHLDGLENAFLTAYTHVSSRDFIVDTWHGVGLVPVADLFNHAAGDEGEEGGGGGNGVQFESDQEVCQFCGTAFLTGHEEDECKPGGGKESEDGEDGHSEVSQVEEEDVEDERMKQEDGDIADPLPTKAEPSETLIKSGPHTAAKLENPSASSTSFDNSQPTNDETLGLEPGQDTLDMRTILPHPASSEIYNTYGPLTNALLLTRYGFSLDTETGLERYTVDLRFPDEREAFLGAFGPGPVPSDCFERDLQKQAKVAKAFIRVLGKVDVFFPSEEEEEWETGGEGDGEVEAMERQTKAVGGIDKLHNLDSFIVGNDDWITDNFSSLFQTSPPSMKGEDDEQAAEVVEVDEDLVDRDQIHPLFVDSHGRISRVLFAFVYLMHHYMQVSSSRSRDIRTILSTLSLKTEDGRSEEVVKATLGTLKRFCKVRLDGLQITHHLEEGLEILSPEGGKGEEYITKACIQHAYQEHAALTSAIATLDDLLITFTK